ncbi:MAG: chromosomal replication initiator protein DnaA [bacterium]|nr:chromosomal replication initiator protein DnaA [bacterium]
MEITNIWDETLTVIQNQMDPHTYESWFKPTRYLSSTSDSLEVEVPNKLFKDWLINNHYQELNSIASNLSKRPVSLNFILSNENNGSSSSSGKKPVIQKNFISKSYLNPKYTFDTFVIGKSNDFAHASCCAVTKNVGNVYNPLYIYGGVGLGKTHLMHAIGHNVLSKNLSNKVCYVSTEQFTNEFINCIQANTVNTVFKEKYRNVDVLLIDDVQFLAGKERIQEEFFHTFNTLYESRRQIVISSDSPPKEINSLEERLRSRFECGLMVDIQPPDFETRVAILSKKASSDGVVIPNDVLEFIAKKITSNVRKLEGALTKVTAQASLNRCNIDISFTYQVIKDFLEQDKAKNITISSIQKHTSAHFGLNPSTMKSKKRSAMIALPRQIAMYLCRKLTDYSTTELGKEFGGRDHTTILFASNKIKNDIKKDSNLEENINIIINKIRKDS